MKLRRRLEVSLTAVTALVLGASFAVAFIMVERDETRDLDETLLRGALSAAGRGSVEDGRSELPEDARLARRFGATFALPSGELLTFTRSLAGAAPSWESLQARPPLPSSGLFRDLTLGSIPTRAVLLPAGPDRALLLALSRKNIDEDLQFLWRVFAILFVTASLGTWLFARRLGARLSRDVERIASTARRVAVGDLAARVPRPVRSADELDRLGSDLDHMIDRLDEAMRSQHTFVSHAAHELRSPLTTLRGELQLALRRPRSAEEYRAAIADALAGVEQLTNLAEDLLTLARIEDGAMPTEATLVRDAIEDALRMARGGADARQVTFEPRDDADAGLRVAGRRGTVARALRNLVDNAIAHSPIGARVRVEATRRDVEVQISVSDDGPGVDPEEAERIFTPFYRGTRDQGQPGAGLGLAIARQIARRAGGDVTLDGEHRGGARFVLSLPRVG